MLYVEPASAVAGPLICGASGVAHCTASLTVIVAVAVAPPADCGNDAVIVALPAASGETLKAADAEPEPIVVDAGTLTTAGFDDVSVTVVPLTRRTSLCAVSAAVPPAVALCDGGLSDRWGTGMVIEPLTRARCPFDCASFVAAVPASSVSCVVAGSSVRVIDVPGVAEEERVKTRWATMFPGVGALSVKGIGLLDC